MKGFRFRLQPVLEQRERAERERELDVARLEKERLTLERKLREQRGFIGESKGALREALGAGVDGSVREGGARVNPSLLRLQATNAMHLNFRAHQTVLGLAGLHTRLERARALLAEAARDRRAIELLKEKRREAWEREAARKERVDQDELVTARAARADDDGMDPIGRSV
ncbi:MAG: hypothetical protein AAGH64_12750 [Planctomycetota bacterium]